MLTARGAAIKVLCEIERNGSYSNIAASATLADAELDRKDSAFMSMLIYGVLTRKITLDSIISKYSSKGTSKLHPYVLNVLRIGVYQLIFMDKIPVSAAVNESVNLIKKSKQSFASGFVNAVLRKISNDKQSVLDFVDNSELQVKYSCPNELCEELVKDLGKVDAEGFLQASLESPELFARVNTLKTTKEELFPKLSVKEIVCLEDEIPNSFTVKNIGNIEKLPEFKEGLFYIQDKASQKAIAELGIKPGMRVLDVCSAPGGKSFTAAMYLNGEGSVTSCDVYEKRVGLISSGAKRLGISNLKAICSDATIFDEDLGKFDIVICDVPCSGLGVIRRKPEIKYRALSTYDDLFDIQLKILKTSANYVSQVGLLMYSTCTVRNSENGAVVNAFLNENSDFKIIKDKTLLTNIDGTDGFYFCIMERV